MKKETQELIKWAMSLIADYRVQNMASHTNFRAQNVPAANYWKLEAEKCKQFAEFLNSLPEIESHLCNGGYIQDRNGTPCCHGDKVRFKFVEKWYEDNFKERYTPVMDGILKFCGDTKKFYIQFGPYRNGYDWLDWSCEDDGCEWFEKAE